MKIAFTTLIRELKKIENDETYVSNIKANDSLLVIKRGRRRCVPVKEASPKMNRMVHAHGSMITDPINDARLVLNFAMNERSNQNGIEYNFRTPSINTVKNYSNLSCANDPSVGLCSTSGSRLKILSRIIASESARTLCSHILMIITTQFRVGKWVNKPTNLSPGAEAAVKLAQHSHQSEEVYPLDMRYLLCFDEHGYNHVSGGHKKDSRRPLGKRSLNSPATDRDEKKFLNLVKSHSVR